jgi:hypothetical protein
MFSVSAWRAVVLALAFLSMLGCSSGPRTYRVTGHVTFDGQPVEDGEILLIPEDKSISPDAAPIQDGVFDFKAKPGVKRVEIRASHAIAQSAMGPVMKEYIPPRYNGESTLREEVQPTDANQFTFDLKGESKKK